jgi:hypothetical protein
MYMTDFVTYGTITGTPKVKPNTEIDTTASAEANTPPNEEVKSLKDRMQEDDNKFSNEVNERNHVAKAQKQMASQETVGVPPQE